ncbi:MAG: hypothetical protein K6F26_03360 [Lachnospiraceae bacterium]|nr:hypothetical protein [Lachnospiraceae bacterium]
MSVDNKYVLAMYDVRGKQNYIFRGRKLKEIVGGSLVIRDVFKDYLYPAADSYAKRMNQNYTGEAIFNYKSTKTDAAFTRQGFENHLKEGFLGEVIYDGGGNFFILYKDFETYKSINQIFTKNVLEHTYSLTVLCSHIEGVDFDNYITISPQHHTDNEDQGDQNRLYTENRKREARINPQMPAQVLPFTQVDYANSLPLYEYDSTGNTKLTREAARKYKKYEEVVKSGKKTDEFDEKVLDHIAKDKGTDSWIAILYIDGNNMGAKVQNAFQDCLKEEEKNCPVAISYEKAVKTLRSFSESIQKEYVDDRLDAIDKRLQEKYGDNAGTSYKRRIVVYAGDEINIILNAHDALDAVKAYFENMPTTGSACAGIALFKSHAPYADAYNIAEQCCESGKKLMKEHKMTEANLVDFHYCQGAIGIDLEQIRVRENEGIISRPWFVSYDAKTCGDIPKEDVVTVKMVEKLAENLNTCARTNIKGLLECAKNSESKMLTELKRMQLRRKNANTLGEISCIPLCDGSGQISDKRLRDMVFDVVSIYDLWFRKQG